MKFILLLAYQHANGFYIRKSISLVLLFKVFIHFQIICEEPSTTEVDLKCSEKVADSDTELQNEPEVRSNQNNRFSPISNDTANEVTCRPKAIKAM